MDHLNENQRLAVLHDSGPLLVIAGAGTGKTRVITERIGRLLNEKKCTSSQILALTFTEKAASEIEGRVDEMMPLGYEPVSLGTFHGFCGKVLRDYGVDIGLSPGYKIMDKVDLWLLLREHLFEFKLDYYRPLSNPTEFIDALISHFGRLKEEVISTEEYLAFAEKKQKEAKTDDETMEAKRILELAHAYEFYQKLLLENNTLDYGDLQFKTIELLKKRPNILKHLQNHYRYILVDEYQDTNIAQNRIVDLLAAGHKNLMVVGDDDQSIYKFRGAAISNILQFEKNYPEAKKIVLTENYRSDQAILDFAYASIQHNNPDRLEVQAKINKKLTGLRPGSAESVHLVHCSTVEQEAEYILEEIQKAKVPLNEIAVLVRANSYAKPIIEAFKKNDIAYQFLSERGLYQKPEVQDLIAVLRVISNPTDDISFYSVLRMPIWDISMETITLLIADAKKAYTSLWQQIKSSASCKLLYDTLKDAIEFSKNHTAGETLFRFAETLQVYQRLLEKNTIEAQEQLSNIASFFGKIREFEQIHAHTSVIDFVAYLDLQSEAGENPSARFDYETEGVQVSTVHSAKGLEFNTVFVSSLTSDRFPTANRKDPIEMPPELISEILTQEDFHIEEERRLFYVACTRAKEKLHLLWSDFYAPSYAKNPRKKKLSRFIEEVLDRVTLTQSEKTAGGVDRFLKPKKEIPAPPLTPEGRITRFSFSQLDNFKRCPRQYQYGYLFKIPSPPSANESFGITLHSTLQEFYTQVMQSRQASLFTEFSADLSLENLLKIYESKWVDVGYDSLEYREARRQRGREILGLFHEKFKTELSRVKFLEKSFKIRVGDYVISGRMDRVDETEGGTLEIIDYKTGSVKTQKQVDSNLQLMIYAIAAEEILGKKASALTLYFLDGDQKVTTTPDFDKLKKAKEEIVETADAINTSDFAPTPSKQVCQWCPFNKICDAAIL